MAELESLQFLFRRFANFGSRRGIGQDELLMDGTKVAKLARDCGILDKNLNRNEIDIIFNKVKAKGKRKINFDEFLECTKLWANKKGIAHSMMIYHLNKKSLTPKVNGTIPRKISFHDDKRTYTGTHRNGGPESVAKGRNGPPGGLLAALLDRSPSDIRGVPLPKTKKGARLRKFVNSFTKEIKDQDEDFPDEIVSPDNYKVNIEGKDYILHPDWEKRVNFGSIGSHDKFFYVNKVTNEKSWSIPTVPAKPPS